MKESSVIVLNTCLYVGLFLFSLWKYKWRNLTSIISLLYAISSVASFLLFNFPLYNVTFTSQGTASVEACLYQFLLNFLLITAFAKCNIDNLKKLTNYNEHYVLQWIKILVVVFGITLIFSLPSSVSQFFSGKDLSDMRNASYDLSERTQLPFVVSLLGRIFGGLSLALISCIAVRFFILHKFTKWDKYGLYVYALLKISTILGMISRATIIFSLFEIFILLCLFYNYISAKQKKLILKVGTVVGIFMFFVFTAISASRFSNGSAKDLDTELANLRYLGESQLNFMTLAYPDLKEPFMGYRMFTMFRRVLGFDYDDGTSREGETVFDSYITKEYHYNHPIYIFYSVSGDFFMNFGTYIALIICLFINILLRRSYKNHYSVSLMQIIVTVTLGAYVGKGIFFADYQNESGNIMLLFLVLFTIFLRYNGKTYIVGKQ